MGKSNVSKPIVLFTSFWDANYLVDKEFFIADANGKPSIIWLRNKDNKPTNYSVHSIALRAPEISQLKAVNARFSEMPRINIFCPTYKMLMSEKQNKNWELYTSRFKELMRSRKEEVKEWVDSLQENHVYILCCWESTSETVHCHRQLLYKSFLASGYVKDRVVSVYRHGNKKMDDYFSSEAMTHPEVLRSFGRDTFSTMVSFSGLGEEVNTGPFGDIPVPNYPLIMDTSYVTGTLPQNVEYDLDYNYIDYVPSQNATYNNDATYQINSTFINLHNALQHNNMDGNTVEPEIDDF